MWIFVDDDLLDGVGRAEAVLEHGAGTQVAQLGLDEGAQVAGRAVLDPEHGVQIIVVLDDHAGTQLGGGNRHATDNLLRKLRSMGPANRGQATCPPDTEIKHLSLHGVGTTSKRWPSSGEFPTGSTLAKE